MKKIITYLFVLLILSIAGCTQAVEPSADTTEEEIAVEGGETKNDNSLNTDIQISENGQKWIEEYLLHTYKSPNLGFEFKYIEGKVETETENAGLDIGEMLKVSVYGLNMSFTSYDYGIGIGEGCCSSFSGPSIDLSKSDAEIELIVEEKLGDIFGLKRVIIGGKKGIYFYRLYTYLNSRLAKSVLIPWDDEIYTNLLITSKIVKEFEGDYKSSVLPEVEKFILNTDLTFDGEVEDGWEVFDPILTTFKFD